MILVSGFNVYPNEIEDVIARHPGVLEVACVGVPDEKSTEAVKIFVVKEKVSLRKVNCANTAKKILLVIRCLNTLNSEQNFQKQM